MPFFALLMLAGLPDANTHRRLGSSPLGHLQGAAYNALFRLGGRDWRPYGGFCVF